MLSPRVQVFAIAILFAVPIEFSFQIQWTEEMSLCARNTPKHAMNNFWKQSADDDCPLDVAKLVSLYTDVMASDELSQCDILVQHEIRKAIVNAGAATLEAACIAHAFNGKRAIDLVFQQLWHFDQMLFEAAWWRAIEALYLFVSKTALLETLWQVENAPSRAVALVAFHRLLLARGDFLPALLPKLSYMLIAAKDVQLVAYWSRKSDLNALVPRQLDALYSVASSSSGRGKVLGLLNQKHNEFLYAPRDNGPDNNRRIPLTWIAEKNTTDRDGHFMVATNANAQISLSSTYGQLAKYLYVDTDENAAYFWIGEGLPKHRWWIVEWRANHHVRLLESETELVLCAGENYDENRRYVVLHHDKLNAAAECLWSVAYL